MLPLWTSVLVRTYAWMVLLGRNGIINRILIDSGLLDAAAAAAQQQDGGDPRHGARHAAVHDPADLQRA